MARPASESRRIISENFQRRVQELRELVDTRYEDHLNGTQPGFAVQIPSHLTSHEVDVVVAEWVTEGWKVNQDGQKLFFKNS